VNPVFSSDTGCDERERAVKTPFEDQDASFVVLVNNKGQHSLWPAFTEVPDGWMIIFGEAGHRDCLDFIEDFGRDMRLKA
jgi:MbtH protein